MTDQRTGVAELPPPHSVEAEQALLGAILINNDAYAMVATTVRPDDFFEPFHSAIFGEIGRLIGAGKKATPVTLKSSFPDFRIGDLSSSQYLARLAAEATTIINAPDYSNLVRDLALVRAVIAVGRDLERSNANAFAPDEALQVAWDKLDTLRSSVATQRGERGGINRVIEDVVKKASEGGQDDSHKVTTGLADLDRAIGGGWRTSRLYVIAGRPGMGKTALAVSSSRRSARHGAGVAYFSLEVDSQEVGARYIADQLARSETPIAYRDIVAGGIQSEFEYERVLNAGDAIRTLPIHVDTSSGLTIAEIEARARMEGERMAKAGLRLMLVIIDYLGLVRVSDRYRGNRVSELGEIALAGKNLSKRLDVACLLLSQLNRAVESRDDKRPSMSDLRDSGNIEEHADFVGLLLRPGYYTQRTPEYLKSEAEALAKFERERNRMDLIIDKNRLGPTFTVNLWCDPALSAVDNWTAYG